MQTTDRSPDPSDVGGKSRQIQQYLNLFDNDNVDAEAKRKDNYAALAKFHHTLASDLYELGWGESFHFCPFEKGESFAEGMRRHECYISDRLGLKPGMKILDAGCGVGGPMREIARHSGATIVGTNIVPEEVERAQRYIERDGLVDQCSVMVADYMKMPFEDNSYDRIYAIGSTPHAPDRTKAYKEFFRILKPGGLFVCDECAMTDLYDPTNGEHRRIIDGIARGYGHPEMVTTEECRNSMIEAGFELVDTHDRALEGDADIPWYSPLDSAGPSIQALARSPIGRRIFTGALNLLALVVPAAKRLMPVQDVLNMGADCTVEGGRLGIVTMNYFMLVKKPE